jgi:propionate CoA-transferase
MSVAAGAEEGHPGPLGRRVNSIVNYEGFSVDDEAMDAYMDAVRYVEKTYYLKVSRFTNSGSCA